jgi:hypothetical protein
VQSEEKKRKRLPTGPEGREQLQLRLQMRLNHAFSKVSGLEGALMYQAFSFRGTIKETNPLKIIGNYMYLLLYQSVTLYFVVIGFVRFSQCKQ